MYLLIRRIIDIPFMEREEVAEIVSKLLEKHGDGFVKKKTAKEIINDTARYYVILLMKGLMPLEIIGCFAVDRTTVPCAKLKSVVIKKEWRNKGIGTRIISIATQYALTEKPCVVACVKKENNKMKKILEKLGYIVRKTTDNVYVYVKYRNEIDTIITEELNKQLAKHGVTAEPCIHQLCTS